MNILKVPVRIFFLLAFMVTSLAFAHPTGNMITVGKHVLWSYIDPVYDPEHHACIMIWSEGTEPKVLVRSEYAASDFMLHSSAKNEIYLVERRYIESMDRHEVRLLKTTLNGETRTIWDWFEDRWRIGESGFLMVSDDQMVFGSYPNIYSLKKGKQPLPYFEFDEPIHKIRAMPNDQILLLGANSCWLVDEAGNIKQQWNDLLEDDVKNAPLGRNQIFDMDCKNEQLLLAYWGKRSFVLIEAGGNRNILQQQREPLAPHWVAFFGEDPLLFSSELVFGGETPKPKLIRFTSNGDTRRIW